ncbi:MAG: PQQ-dependent sugar dehydrogenase [Candidatus Hydrothermarchaeaceae archaeon]
MKKHSIVLIFIIITAFFLWWGLLGNREGDLPPAVEPAPGNAVLEDIPLAASVAKGLEIPWALDFLPDGGIVFTERAGRVRLIDADEGLLSEPLKTISEVSHVGEGGLLGISVHPDFSQNQFIYVYYTYGDGKNLKNRVVRYRMQDKNLLDEKVIIEGIPGARFHNGGRIKFGPDGHLYITTGDALSPDGAQDKNSLSGKILRLRADGTIPKDNPFPGSPVYSIGHRNPQGLAWTDLGALWETEHGSSAADEVNLIEMGKNYGWPIVRGNERAEGLNNPVIHSGSDTWAPSGAAYLNGSLFFAGLRGQSLYELVLEDERVTLQPHLNGKFGRIRDVVASPDNFLYILTNNRDGRGIPTSGDDQIIRINPEKLS